MGCQGSKPKAGLPEKRDLPATATSTLSKTLLAAGEVAEATKSKDHLSSTGEGIGVTSSDATPSNGAQRNGTNSFAMLKNQQRALCTDRNEINMMVRKFFCQSSTVGNAIGRNSKEIHWAVGHDRRAPPLDIKLHVQEHKLHSTGVRVELNGQPIFGGAGAAKSPMMEDFCYRWPLRATIRGISEQNFYEMQFPHSMHDIWFPATITCQREDGLFEVTAHESNQYGEVRDVKYPAVDRNNLREALTRKPVVVPEDVLLLEVPKEDPLQAALKLASGKLITQHFGKPSPPLLAQERELCFKVKKDRSQIIADAGVSVLAHFVSGEVKSIKSDVERLRRTWALQLGPFAEHTVEISKNYTLGKVITLLVDGEVLIECTPADIGCSDSEWSCTFKLVGERVMDFEVHKTNKDGSPLEATDHVKERRSYMHECKVVLPNDWDFSHAKLLVDGVQFSELPIRMPEREEQELCMDPVAFQHAYGITVPFKIDHTAPSDLQAFAQNLVVKAHVGKGIAENIGCQWLRCCTASSAVKDEVVVH
jgi:hypothetical protein